MADIPTQIIKVARPVHWVKNLALFAALLFSGNLFTEPYLARVSIAFISFSFAASAGYILNDIVDAEQDRLHPIKKDRPIASKKLPETVALASMLGFALGSLLIASSLNNLFFFSVSGYMLLQVLYSLGFKNIHIIDILVIASGFILRVYAGAFVIDAHLSVWFLLCVVSAALFLASGKRRAEMGVITGTKAETRKSLNRYSKTLLDSYVTMFGNAAWLSWALFTFFESPSVSTDFWLFLAEISRTTTISKLLMVTIPVAIFSVMRYQHLIFEDRTEAPEKLILTDAPLVGSIAIWVGLVMWILYGGVAQTSPIGFLLSQ
jgi:4-hydroxybenzoate polyprenyltransferase